MDERRDPGLHVDIRVFVALTLISFFMIPVAVWSLHETIDRQYQEVKAIGKNCPELLKVSQNLAYTKSIQGLAKRTYNVYC